ncbi:hypothetical protein E4U21_000089 [Claviceps maximensis]|nr:hypothetical protein E4U21_000089 [Claviceps maximensis]
MGHNLPQPSVAQNLPQPDFPKVADALDVVVRNVRLLPNVPVFDSGATICGKLDLLMEKVALLDQKVDQLDRKVDQLDRKVDKLDEELDQTDEKVNRQGVRFSALDKNTRGRAINVVIKPDMTLEPLYSPLSGEQIPGCPETWADLDCLTAR